MLRCCHHQRRLGPLCELRYCLPSLQPLLCQLATEADIADRDVPDQLKHCQMIQSCCIITSALSLYKRCRTRCLQLLHSLASPCVHCLFQRFNACRVRRTDDLQIARSFILDQPEISECSLGGRRGSGVEMRRVMPWVKVVGGPVIQLCSLI